MDIDVYNRLKPRAAQLEKRILGGLDNLHQDAEFVKELGSFMNDCADVEGDPVITLWALAQKRIHLLFAIHPIIQEKLVNLVCEAGYDLSVETNSEVNWSGKATELLFPELVRLSYMTSEERSHTLAHEDMDKFKQKAKEWFDYLAEVGQTLDGDYCGQKITVTFKELRPTWYTLKLDGTKQTSFGVFPIFLNKETGKELCPKVENFKKYTRPFPKDSE